MVDVSAKPVTARRAIAEAMVSMSAETLSLVIDGGGTKGDVLGVAELAGVMGAKRTSDLIPLCHPLALTDLQVSITPDRVAGVLRIRAEAATTGQTGVEMEAMTAASRASSAASPSAGSDSCSRVAARAATGFATTRRDAMPRLRTCVGQATAAPAGSRSPPDPEDDPEANGRDEAGRRDHRERRRARRRP